MTEYTTPQKTTQSKLVITIEIFASVVGVLIVINVITITLKHRNRNYDIEEDKLQDEYATSDLPSGEKVFDNVTYVPYERMDNDIV